MCTLGDSCTLWGYLWTLRGYQYRWWGIPVLYGDICGSYGDISTAGGGYLYFMGISVDLIGDISTTGGGYLYFMWISVDLTSILWGYQYRWWGDTCTLWEYL